MKPNKKALFFEGLMFFVVLIVLTTVLFTLYKKQNQFPDEFRIGERQFSLVKAYQKGERALFYIDESARHSAYQTISDLANKGGYYDVPACGSFGDFNAWASIEKDNKNQPVVRKCYPDRDVLREGFRKFFHSTFSEYVANYPEYIENSYSYELDGNLEIKWQSSESMVFGIALEKPKAEARKPAAKETISTPQQKVETPQILKVAMKSNPDVETIKQEHPEVWSNYVEFCRRMKSEPGICNVKTAKCCVTTGGAYRHPAYNKEKSNVDNSPHQYGVALDIHVGRDTKEQLRWAREAVESGLFTRAGIYPGDTHIHVDRMPLEGQYALRYWIGRKSEILARANNIAELENRATKFT